MKSTCINCSLGIEIHGHTMEPLIPAGTELPCQNSQQFSTAGDLSSSVTIRVLSGEYRQSCHDLLLGQIEFPISIPMRRDETNIEIIFEVDHNRMLQVCVLDCTTETQRSLQVAVPEECIAPDSNIEKRQNRIFAERSRYNDGAEGLIDSCRGLLKKSQTLQRKNDYLIKPNHKILKELEDTIKSTIKSLEDSIQHQNPKTVKKYLSTLSKTSHQLIRTLYCFNY